MMRLRRKQRKAGGSATPTREVRGLTEDDRASFLAAADQRRSGTVPSIYDLMAMLEELRHVNSIEARSTERQLRWLMRAGDQYLGANWEHPFT